MERVVCDLRKLIDVQMRSGKQRPFSDKCALGFMLSIALGVRYLHRAGIVHRNLKPTNILVCTDSTQFHDIADLRPNLLNIKVAGYDDTEDVVGYGLWRTAAVLQAIEKGIDIRGAVKDNSDVYGFAMLCYEILTGRPPFEGHPMSDIHGLVLSGIRPEIPPYVSRDLRELLQRCWHWDPYKRPDFSEIVPAISYQLLNVCHAEMSRITSVREEFTMEDASGTCAGTFRIFCPPLPSQASSEESKASQETSDANSECQRVSGSYPSLCDRDDIPLASSGVA